MNKRIPTAALVLALVLVAEPTPAAHESTSPCCDQGTNGLACDKVDEPEFFLLGQAAGCIEADGAVCIGGNALTSFGPDGCACVGDGGGTWFCVDETGPIEPAECADHASGACAAASTAH